MQNYYQIEFNTYIDKRGSLLPFELNKNCPFDIKRCFCIYGVPSTDIVRGDHINKNTAFVLIALSGKVSVEIDSDDRKEVFVLNSINKGLFIDKGVKKRMYNFSKDAIILCLSDEYYDSFDYK